MIVPGWGDLTPHQRDAAFDNRWAVPGADALRADRIRRSQALRIEHPACLDQPYGARPRNRWDLFPADDRTAPCLIFIHGGYWQNYGREEFACVAAGVLAAGWAAALPGYTLAPNASLSEIDAEIHSALNWFRDNAAAFGIAGRVVLGGWSAGATLAALNADHAIVDSLILLSGIFDLAPLAETSLNRALQLTADEIARMSPVRRPPPQKPVYLAVGADELPALVENSRALADHYGGRCDELIGHNHFSILDVLGAKDSPLVARLTEHQIRQL